MLSWNRCAKINVKVLIILIIVTVALGASLFAARQVRRSFLSKISLEAGQAAFENEDWLSAYRNFQEYLGRNPDDVEILKKYAKAALAIRPLDAAAVGRTIAAYRRVMQLDPLEEIAYEKLAMLYNVIGNFEELAYIARKRIADLPNDQKAQLWLAEALIGLNKMEDAQAKLTTLKDKIWAFLPDKHDEYVPACLMLSNIEGNKDSPLAKTKALGNLNDAIRYAPESVDALASRARFYRVTTNVSDPTAEERLAAARKDLEKVDDLNTENPRIRLFLAEEWMAHGELDRAANELRAAESLPQETLEEHFFGLNNWAVVRFLLASELAIQRGTTTECASLADETLIALKEKKHRIRVLPYAIRLYVAAGNALDARQYLDEYVETMYIQKGQVESQQVLAYLRAMVAKAEDDSYAIIDVLQSAIVSDTSRPELWGLLAEAFSRTDQTRRAVSALIKYLRLRPQDAEMRRQLVNEYIKLRNWSKALEAALLAEDLSPTDIALTLLRIEVSINIVVEQEGHEVTTAKRQALEDEKEKLAELREEHPDSVDIRILQAFIAFSLDDPNTAENELKQAIEDCEEPLRAEMQLARLYSRMKRMPEAINVCQTACELHSEVAEPWLYLSTLHAANADYDSALSWLRKGLDTVVGKWEKRLVSIRLALRELMHGDQALGLGIKLLTELASQDKREVYARTLLLGIRKVQEDQARFQELIDEIKDAEGESGLKWRLYKAAMLLASDEWRSKQPDIVSYLQYCIDSDPEWSSPPLLLAEMYNKLGDSKRVEDTYRQAFARNPSAIDITDKLVNLLEKQGRLADAEKVLQQSEADARAASAWHVRMALRTRDFSRAIEELKFRVANDDRDANSRILLARLVYLEEGDDVQAFVYLNEAEAITPNSLVLTAVRASIWRAKDETEKAQGILDEYVAARSNDFNAYWMRAVYLTEEGELERAEKDYRKLTTFTEQGAIGYELLSNFYSRNEKLAKAIEALEEGLDEYPEDLRLKRRLMKTLILQADAQGRQRALEILAALEEQLPQDPELMKFRALQILEESTPQSLEAARGKLENVVKLEPTAVDAHLLLIGIMIQEGEYETARDSAIRAVGSNPNNLALLLARGRAELELGNIKIAVELTNLVLQKDPTNTGALGVLLDSAIRSGNNSLIEDATALAHLMLEEDPNKTEVRDVIVTKAVESKDRSLLEVARTLIESALGSNPTDEKLLISRARVLAFMELPQDAIPELEAYCQTKNGSSSVAAIVTLADLYRLAGDMDQAKQRIEQAERVDPNNQVVIHSRLIWLVAQNRFEELAGISSAYLSAKEQNPTTLVRAASVLAALDTMTLKKEGLKLFEHAVTLSPRSKDARLGLAFTLYQTGNAERAENIYQELLEQYPNNIQILNDLAWILQEHYQHYADALKLADRASKLALNDLYILDTRGTILSNLPGRLADAKKDFERLVELSSSDTRQRAKALLQLGRICSKLNDLDHAKQHLKNALEIDQKIDVFTPDERSEIARLQRSKTQAINN